MTGEAFVLFVTFVAAKVTVGISAAATRSSLCLRLHLAKTAPDLNFGRLKPDLAFSTL
jgi:hypothetical protein